MPNKKVVYTAITNKYDTLIRPNVTPSDIDFICFTDDHRLTSEVWKMVYIENLNHKEPKILSHKYVNEYERSMWVDANVRIRENLNELFDKYTEKPIYTFKHPERMCIYKEAISCNGLDKKQNIEKMMEHLKKEKYPTKNGLSSCNIILRNKQIIPLNEEWFKYVDTYTRRDQLSYHYVLWKQKINFGYMDGNVRDSKKLIWNGNHYGY